MIVAEEGVDEFPHLLTVDDAELDECEIFDARRLLTVSRGSHRAAGKGGPAPAVICGRASGRDGEDMKCVRLVLHASLQNTIRVRPVQFPTLV